MSDCKKCQALFLQAFYEELDTPKKQFFEDHLLVCERCKSEFKEMESTLNFTGKRVRPEPPKEFWDSYEERLAQRIEKEEVLKVESESFWKRLWRPFIFAPRWTFQAAAAIALIVVGVLIGRMIFSPSIPESQQASRQQGLVTPQRPGIELAQRSQGYIERSKLILLALVNFDPATEDPYALDLSLQKQVSSELIQEASVLKKELAESDQEQLQRLIANLEMILLQIANLESDNDFEAIELVKEGINRQGILMQINLSDLRRSRRGEKESMSLKPPSNKPKKF